MIHKLVLTFILSLCYSFANKAYSQELSNEMQTVYSACIKMSNAIESSNKQGLRAANTIFKNANTKDFQSLRLVGENSLSLDGHFVFDEVFVDSLLAGHNVYKFAQRYAQKRTKRGTSARGGISTKTCAVKAKSSVKYSFASKGRQEIAVVTEPGGLVSLRIYDKTNKIWYNDTKDVKKGQPYRYLVFDLPSDKRCVLEMEIINTSKNNISFVVISN